MNIDERLANDPDTELARAALEPHVTALVASVDPLSIDGQAKHDAVKSAVTAMVPILQGSVKELRIIPPDVLAEVIDFVIEGALSLLRSIL